MFLVLLLFVVCLLVVFARLFILFLSQLGGYTLLHLAAGNPSRCSPAIVELLLQHGADPNSVGSRVEELLDTGDVNAQSLDKKEEKEKEGGDGGDGGGRVGGGGKKRRGKEKVAESDHKKKKEIAGENEGDCRVTPLHTLCSVLPPHKDDREEVSLRERGTESSF